MWLCVLLACAIGMASAATSVLLNSYLQPNDDIDRNAYLLKAQSSNCARMCNATEAPKICYYQWTIENYVTVSGACGNCPVNTTACYNPQCITADGYERSVLSINRKLPGPSIEVCLRDRVIVDITNNMAGRTTAIHWHGLFQRGSQYMDGVPMVTQCSIHEGDTFRYDFIANNEGTHFWHSHDDMLKSLVPNFEACLLAGHCSHHCTFRACGNCPANVTACDAPQCVVANGYEKSIRTINRMVPGPSIQVCLGDRIIIDLRNNLAGSQLTIHWHGVFQQGTQYMDGVPMVTQCSVLEGDVFRYDFLANNEGTHYWHSHDGKYRGH
ncbi:hypothetical protein Cfor_01834 [Coptotermes formosanus]|uniref:Plastocyanin-like domain-containing protein n=1 Tax=Coptotermes formosanus TaxID=36987 RepID=A0A6L2PUA8_COPFO|nr:hypothetical protein Cfor_01834 [Coptotermes formosanus]